MAKYRATRTEGRVSIGEWTLDAEKGQVFESGNKPGQVPDRVCEYLVDQGLFVEATAKAVDNPWFDSESEELQAMSEENK